MNVLILTPDRVGSTLLQRLITIYMVGNEFDKPVINLHELTNGLMTYYNHEYNREVVGKPNRNKWGYYQSLSEIVNLLDKVDHYKTARLAHYHIKRRQDSLKDQIDFYNYINENFYIISAKRENLFEHALSWGIFTVSKRLNVYDHNEKYDAFYNIYKNGITLDQDVFTNYLTAYKDYLSWVDSHFDVSNYFVYERDLPNIENYILNLNIFPTENKRNWNDIFDIEWSNWNKCHKLISDLGSVKDLNLLEYDSASKSFPLQKLQTDLSIADKNFVLQHATKYKNAYNGIQHLVNLGTLVTGIPIKLQTLAEKHKIIKNFDSCINWYNDWVQKNNLGSTYSLDDVKVDANKEVNQWYLETPKHLLLK